MLTPEVLIYSMGKNVRLTQSVDEYGDGSKVYPVGAVGRLDGLSGDLECFYASIEFPNGDYTDNVPIDVIEFAK